jgi:hypothetical protein
MPAAMRTKQKVSLASALPRLAGHTSARWHWHQHVGHHHAYCDYFQLECQH